MNRLDFEQHIVGTYSAAGEFPWVSSPTHQVFRHRENKKWFALLMDIPKEKLGLMEAGEISVVNLKCDPRLIGSLCMEQGIFPAWHMNKSHWITVALDGTVDEEKLKFLLDLSYELTKKQIKQR